MLSGCSRCVVFGGSDMITHTWLACSLICVEIFWAWVSWLFSISISQYLPERDPPDWSAKNVYFKNCLLWTRPSNSAPISDPSCTEPLFVDFFGGPKVILMSSQSRIQICHSTVWSLVPWHVLGHHKYRDLWKHVTTQLSVLIHWNN